MFFSGARRTPETRRPAERCRVRRVWAEGVSTFEGGNGHGGVIPCALCAEARNSAWATFGILTRMRLPLVPGDQRFLTSDYRSRTWQ